MEAEAKPAAAKMTLKLLVDKKTQKVVFAESSKDFVDFLFSLLSLPIGTVIHLLTTSKMVGSFGNLYKSVETLSDTYIQPDKNKDSLLKPPLLFSADFSRLLLTDGADFSTRKFYTCPNRHRFTDDRKARCSGYQCGREMATPIDYVPVQANGNGGKNDAKGGEGGGGFVKGVVIYTITDDLVIEPMSTISCVALLVNNGVKELSDLEDRVVQVGMDEGLQLLREAMMSKRVLTNVFLGKMEAEAEEAAA